MIFQMTVTKTYIVSNNQVVIDLPKDFRGKTKVNVTIEDVKSTDEEKFALMEKAISDPLFIQDLNEIAEDFNSIDNE